MNEEEFYFNLVKFVMKALLDYTKNQSEALKIIVVGVHSALDSHKKGGKGGKK